MKNNNFVNMSYKDKVHKLGKTTVAISTLVILAVPLVMSVVLGVAPDAKGLLGGLLATWILFVPISIIEFVTYGTMLGSAGSYLGFISGNLSNLKVPCALNALNVTKEKSGTEEGDIITTLSVAASSIITTLIIVLGVIVLGFVKDVLYSPALVPAFDNLLPALFGGLALVLIGKNYKLAVAPLALCVSLYAVTTIINLAFNASINIPVALLVPISAALSIFVARKMYKANKLNLEIYK